MRHAPAPMADTMQKVHDASLVRPTSMRDRVDGRRNLRPFAPFAPFTAGLSPPYELRRHSRRVAAGDGGGGACAIRGMTSAMGCALAHRLSEDLAGRVVSVLPSPRMQGEGDRRPDEGLCRLGACFAGWALRAQLPCGDAVGSVTQRGARGQRMKTRFASASWGAALAHLVEWLVGHLHPLFLNAPSIDWTTPGCRVAGFG